MKIANVSLALEDISGSIGRSSLIAMLGWHDVKQRYRRSALGPFWLTISMGVMIGTIGVVFGQIFKTPMQEFLPFLAAGMILWTYISSVVSEGCLGFIHAEGVIKQLPIPMFVHILRMMWRNILILGHNIVILPFVFLAVGKPVGLIALLSVPGFVLASLNLAWIALLLGVICARYRDLPQIVASVLQIAFYLTPIMWMPSLLPATEGISIFAINPLFHVIDVIREPLLGHAPSPTSWFVVSGLALVGWISTLLVFGRYKTRIAYWL